MKFSLALAFLSALHLTSAAPTCSLKTSSVAAAATPTPTTPTSTLPSGNTTTGAGTNGTISMTWFADWRTNYTVSDVQWSKYTHVAFFAVSPSPSLTLDLSTTDPSTISDFVSTAHSNGVKALLTVGGWDGSMYWSSSVDSAQNRSTFATAVLQVVNSYGFDGVDFDWEYPNKQGVGCNTINSNDTANFLEFITEMRQQASNITYSAAVSVAPFYDTNGQPSTDLSDFAQQLDWIEIMNYDVYGSFSTVTGPNSPLNDTCASSGNQQGSAVSAVASWTKAGIPANKIVLGVAAYGHSFSVPSSTAVVNGNQLTVYTSFNKASEPAGDAWDDVTGTTDICGNPNPASGVYQFWGLVGYGFLNQDGSVASGKLSLYDDCSQTPYVYDPVSEILVSYDNAQSFTAKGQYIAQSGLLGFAMYEAGGDYNNMLVDAITKGLTGS
ncbi:glycoside hydrolase family 18 protein [Phlebopus sp. FC_14]|nr:glycoside hydrolase family 18 protein [Phlebopus sp. FC_14]